MKKSFAMFGADGVAAVKKELLQLHNCNVIKAKDHTDLDSKQEHESLGTLCS
jgi:hypothetical protein